MSSLPHFLTHSAPLRARAPLLLLVSDERAILCHVMSVIIILIIITN